MLSIARKTTSSDDDALGDFGEQFLEKLKKTYGDIEKINALAVTIPAC